MISAAKQHGPTGGLPPGELHVSPRGSPTGPVHLQGGDALAKSSPRPAWTEANGSSSGIRHCRPPESIGTDGTTPVPTLTGELHQFKPGLGYMSQLT